MPKEKLTVLSATLAEIYMQQGHFDKAREMYEKLLMKDHSNTLYKSRLALLTKETPGTKRLKLLSALLKRIEQRRDEREAAK